MLVGDWSVLVEVLSGVGDQVVVSEWWVAGMLVCWCAVPGGGDVVGDVFWYGVAFVASEPGGKFGGPGGVWVLAPVGGVRV